MMIKGQEIFKYIDQRAKYITKDKDGKVSWFSVKPITVCGLWGSNNGGFLGCLGEVEIEEFAGKDWNECILEKEQDAKDWIGCLCYFWDVEKEKPIINILKSITGNIDCPFLSNGNVQYACCRPVKKSEVKFFEDKE